MIKKLLSTATLAGACLLPAAAMAQAPEAGWNFSVMPYLWLPSIDAKLNYGPPPAGGASARVETDADTYLDSLDFALMIAGTARKDRWVVGTDIIYLHFSNSDSTVKGIDFNPGPGQANISTSAANASVGMDLKGLVWQLAGGYALVRDAKTTVDVIGGFRYLGLDAKTDANVAITVTGTGPAGLSTTISRSGSVQKSENVWAGIVGAQARFGLGDSPWFAKAYVDVGGGSSTFTWQGLAGIGYAFKWGDVVLDYRYLSYDQDGNDKLIDKMSFGGLALGANFRF
jgi:hypothetical protein